MVLSSPVFIHSQSFFVGKACWAGADLQLVGELAEPQLPREFQFSWLNWRPSHGVTLARLWEVLVLLEEKLRNKLPLNKFNLKFIKKRQPDSRQSSRMISTDQQEALMDFTAAFIAKATQKSKFASFLG